MSRLCNSSHEVPPCLVVHRVPSQKTGNVGGGSVLQAVFLVPPQKSGNLRGGSVLQAALRVPSQKGGNTSESNFQRDGVLQVWDAVYSENKVLKQVQVLEPSGDHPYGFEPERLDVVRKHHLSSEGSGALAD